MTFLLREVARFLIEAAIWLAALGVLASLIALTWRRVRREPITARIVAVGAAGAAITAAVAERLSVPLAWAPEVGGRELPVAWAGLGALLAVVAWDRRSRVESDVGAG